MSPSPAPKFPNYTPLYNALSLVMTVFRTPFSPCTAACVSYALASAAVTLMNKVVFSHAHFNFPWFTLAFQNLISILVISLARATGYTSAGKLNKRLVRSMPMPILFFVLFIFTNAQSLRYVNLPVLTVWKSLGPMFVTLFERLYFRDHFSTHVYLSMLLIVLSAFVTAINDLEYSIIGYFWAAMNVLANVAYLASLRIFLSDAHMSPLDKTFHSNLLSIIPILPLSIISGEIPAVLGALAQRSFMFKLAYVGSGFLTTAVCASAFWTITLTNGSTLSFIGGFNKVPIILLSLFLFDMRISVAGWVGVTLGVIAGIVFVSAKSKSKYVALPKQQEPHVDKPFIVDARNHGPLAKDITGLLTKASSHMSPSEIKETNQDFIHRSKSDPRTNAPLTR